MWGVVAVTAPVARWPKLLRAEPGHLRHGEETNIAPGENQCISDPLEPAELHREVIEALGIALLLGPRASAATGDKVPELEIVAREVVGALSELEGVAASREPAHCDLEGAEPSKRREEVRAEATHLVAPGIATRTSIGASARLRLDAQVAMTLVESLTKPLAADRGGGPDDRRTRRHLAAIILRWRCATRPFSWTRDMRK